ncbi:MAG: InlB B-repeat-containing protein [Prevotella sp.]|nr:InlB B-repeat-containing protein [Prevotella sp.]
MKKLFTLLTLALISIGSAWGADGDLFSAVCTATGDVSIPNKTTEVPETEITTNATISGGRMYVINGQSSAKKLLTKNGFCMTNNNTYFKIVLNTALAVGDEISVTYTGGDKDGNPKGVKVSSTEYTEGNAGDHDCTGTSITVSDQILEYYVKADDEYVGKTTLYIYRAVGATQNFKSIKVTSAANIVKHSVTYSLGDGSGTTPTQTDVKEERTFTVADAPTDIAAPTGKEFKCWNDGTTDYNAGDTYTMGTNNVTLTAVYQTITTKYTITYNLGEGTGTAPTQTDLAESAEFAVAAAPGDLVAPTGKEFKCWNDGTTDYNAGATYTMPAGNVTLTAVYQDRTYKGLTPATTLDLSDVACTTFTTTWYTSNNMIKNSYYNAADGVVSFSPYGIYQSTSTQTWADKSSGNSGDNSWDATGVFKGSSYYFSKDSKCAQLRESRIHYYRITNCSGVSALVGGKAILEVYEVSAGVVTPDPVNESSVDAAGTITISGLNTSKEYIIAIRGNNGDSNVPFQEIAFNFPAVATTSVSVSSYEWATFCSDYALDFTGSDVKAYIVTGEEGNAITKEEVTSVAAGTPLLLNASEGNHDITVAASGTDYSSTNKLQRGADAAVSKPAEGSAWVLGVEDEKAMFQYIDGTPATVSTDKAYLLLESTTPTEARSLFLDDDVTGIKNIKVGSEDNIYYDLQGRRVLYPTKGLYIVNGKKVILK